MRTNQSPWLHQLNRSRPVTLLENDHHTDAAIIGGGIAGIATAYYTLKNTQKKVALVEAGKIAHGATGHNGGFLATYFERTFFSLSQEFGLAVAADAQQAMESTWTQLDEIKQSANLQTPIWQFTGYAACATLDEVLVHLRDNALLKKAGIPSDAMIVSESFAGISDIPDMYRELYVTVPKQDLLALLETNDDSYVGALPSRKGCMNSALFCEELIAYLLSAYSERFVLAEHAPVRRLVLKDNHAVLDLPQKRKISAKEVVLCTNGFENITIVNIGGPPINKKFHHLVRGIVGYMAGYTEERIRPPAEISYLPKESTHGPDIYEEEPYFYLTRRPYITETQETHSLISIGGPEALMDDTNDYNAEHPYLDEARDQINNFLRYTYAHSPKDTIAYKYFWHGLMGFTPNGVRLIGPEPRNPILYYNLGCNGVGLMPSLYGGLKISRHLAGEKVSPSIFDPKETEGKQKKFKYNKQDKAERTMR